MSGRVSGSYLWSNYVENKVINQPCMAILDTDNKWWPPELFLKFGSDEGSLNLVTARDAYSFIYVTGLSATRQILAQELPYYVHANICCAALGETRVTVIYSFLCELKWKHCYGSSQITTTAIS